MDRDSVWILTPWDHLGSSGIIGRHFEIAQESVGELVNRICSLHFGKETGGHGASTNIQAAWGSEGCSSQKP